MTPEYLGVTGFANYVGLNDDTIQGYYKKGLLPEPDIYYVMRNGRRPAWTVDTAEYWMNNRPGRGSWARRRKKANPATNQPNDN